MHFSVFLYRTYLTSHKGFGSVCVLGFSRIRNPIKKPKIQLNRNPNLTRYTESLFYKSLVLIAQVSSNLDHDKSLKSILNIKSFYAYWYEGHILEELLNEAT